MRHAVAAAAGLLARAGALTLAAMLAACSGPGTPATPASGHPLSSHPLSSDAQSSHRAAAARPGPADPPSVGALLRIAQAFNTAYDSGRYGAVYDRWDARSQAIISRAEYIRRHRECQTAQAGAPVRVESAARGPDGRWLVRYVVQGAQSVDTWFYLDHHWVFDIILSNPAAAAEYRLPFARYAAAVGCHP